MFFSNNKNIKRTSPESVNGWHGVGIGGQTLRVKVQKQLLTF